MKRLGGPKWFKKGKNGSLEPVYISQMSRSHIEKTLLQLQRKNMLSMLTNEGEINHLDKIEQFKRELEVRKNVTSNKEKQAYR